MKDPKRAGEGKGKMAKTYYISKRYIREKWDALKWDIEKYLEIYDTTTDKIDAEKVEQERGNIDHCLTAIRKELLRDK